MPSFPGYVGPRNAGPQAPATRDPEASCFPTCARAPWHARTFIVILLQQTLIKAQEQQDLPRLWCRLKKYHKDSQPEGSEFEFHPASQKLVSN